MEESKVVFMELVDETTNMAVKMNAKFKQMDDLLGDITPNEKRELLNDKKLMAIHVKFLLEVAKFPKFPKLPKND